jgi:hypothetical protein
MSCGYDLRKGRGVVTGSLIANEASVVLVQHSPLFFAFRIPFWIGYAILAQVRKILNVLHELMGVAVTVPRIWVKVDSNVVVDVVVVQLGIVPSVVKLFGVASVKVEVILHPFQRIFERSGLRIPVVLCESVTLSFAC